MIGIFLISCKNEKVYDVPIDVILDHSVRDVSIKNNRELFDLLTPFPETTGSDSIILNFVPRFIRVDIDPVYLDSLKIDSTWLIKWQTWLGGGRDNPSLFIRNRLSEINDASISKIFLNPISDQSRVDSFLFRNPGRYFLLSGDTSLVHHYQTSFGNNSLIPFTSPIQLKEYLRLRFDTLNKLVQPIRVIFFPRFKYVPKIDTIAVKETTDSTAIVLTEFGNQSPTKNGPAKFPDSINDPRHQLNPCEQPVETLLETCLAMPSGEPKLVFFYNKIFRFVKNNPCNSAVYKQLLLQIQPLITGRVTNFIQRGNNVYFNLNCSHLPDLIKEFERLDVQYDSSAISRILESCPSNRLQ